MRKDKYSYQTENICDTGKIKYAHGLLGTRDLYSQRGCHIVFFFSYLFHTNGHVNMCCVPTQHKHSYVLKRFEFGLISKV